MITKKDHFLSPFIDQILDMLLGQGFYYFLDGYSGYNQLAIHPDDQENTTFTCPFATYAFQRMPFGLCNPPATFQRCMMAIFSDFIGESLEVFMDDFSVFGPSFDACLEHLTRILDVCVKKCLVLIWEKSHFMVREGIVLGHLVSSKGLEMDKAKVEVIHDLELPKSVRELRSFLCHVGFYRRFIKDFAKWASLGNVGLFGTHRETLGRFWAGSGRSGPVQGVLGRFRRSGPARSGSDRFGPVQSRKPNSR